MDMRALGGATVGALAAGVPSAGPERPDIQGAKRDGLQPGDGSLPETSLTKVVLPRPSLLA